MDTPAAPNAKTRQIIGRLLNAPNAKTRQNIGRLLNAADAAGIEIKSMNVYASKAGLARITGDDERVTSTQFAAMLEYLTPVSHTSRPLTSEPGVDIHELRFDSTASTWPDIEVWVKADPSLADLDDASSVLMRFARSATTVDWDDPTEASEVFREAAARASTPADLAEIAAAAMTLGITA